MADAADELKRLIGDCVAADELKKAVFSRPADRSSQVSRVDVRPILLKGRRTYQFASRTGNQEVHQNLLPEQAAGELMELASGRFRDITIHTTTAVWFGRRSRKGVCSLKQQVRTDPPAGQSDDDDSLSSHDRRRQYLIPDGVPVPFLVATGIMSADGRVKAKHFRKFRQINRFAEFIRDVADRLPSTGTLRVIDFGCGKSYLTFATHYLLTSILGRDAAITGLDRRADVIETCVKIVEELRLPGLNFAVGDIASLEPDGDVHLTISLHACDTATDDALAKAVLWRSAVILAVPCCQHELAAALSRDVQPMLSRHGILHERFCAMATDAVRASLLEQAGYSTVVQEFIDMQHTPKNVLIRAIRRTATDRPRDVDDPAAQLRKFSETFRLPMLRLERQLEEYGLLTAR
ncbi:MAG: SAM-dependent methyltransferase [Planctomycetaceae bacterium]